VPHFEKMLYDNAQLALLYLDAFQCTKDLEFSTISEETLDYVVREMTHPAGGFYCATDADSEGEEGKFFVWSRQEILEVLGAEDGAFLCDFYGVTEDGNFEGQNILHRHRNTSNDRERETLSRCQKKLYNRRVKRVPPITDDKILTSWNGLMIAAFARGAFVLDRDDYGRVARNAAKFVLENLQSERGYLLRSYRNKKAQVKGFLDDYAFMVFGLLELFEATGEAEWFLHARKLQNDALDRFWDESQGGFFLSSRDHEVLLAREKPYYDGAEPSGNAISTWNLMRLYSLTNDSRYREYGEKTLSAFSEVLHHTPYVAPFMATALSYQLSRPLQIVLIRGDEASRASMNDVLRSTYVPNRVIVQTSEAERALIEGELPLIRGRHAINGKTTAYVCEGQSCDLPTHDPQTFATQLSDQEPLE
jgi:hypothetical protein